jgi:hypothetical protein
MTDTITLKNIDLSSRITHYSYIVKVYLKMLRLLENRTWIVVVWGLFDVLRPNLPDGTEENHENPEPLQSVPRPLRHETSDE